MAMTPRPLWRWWIFCAVDWLWWRWKGRPAWLSDLYSWCILADWVHDGSPIDTAGTEPF